MKDSVVFMVFVVFVANKALTGSGIGKNLPPP